jgi:hypothetical protein
VLLSVMLMFLYVSMPLCVVLWPVPELSWLATSAMKALGVALIVPSVWAILFSLSAAVNADVITLAPSHSVIDTVIIRPLAGITLMLLCITIPRFLMRTAMIGPQGQPGGWRVWRTVTFGMFAARAAAGGGQAVAAAAVEGHAGAARMIDSLPSPIRPPSEPGAGNLASRIAFGRSGFPEEEKGKGKGGTRPQQDWGAGEQPADTASGASADTQSQGAPAEQTTGSSGESQSAAPSRRAMVEAAGEQMYAKAHSDPTNATQVADAMGKLPEKAQRRLAEIQATEPSKLRDSIANRIDHPGWSQAQQQALFTIGSSDGRSAEEGIGHAIHRLNSTAPQQAAGRHTAPEGQAAGDTLAGLGVTDPAASGGSAPGSTAGQPAAGAQQPSSANSPTGATSQPSDGTLTSGSRSIGADLREQPAPGGNDGAGTPDGGLVDPEPFLE